MAPERSAACLVSALITFLGIIFAQIYYVESLPSLESYESGRTGRPALSLKLSPVGVSSGSSRQHRSASSISQLSQMSDTDTLVGSPAADWPKRVDSQDFSGPVREYKPRDDDDDDGEYDDQGDSLLSATTSLLGKAPPTGVDVGKGSGGVDLHRHAPGEGNPWGFWDLLKWRPVRVMCSTMFLNSYVRRCSPVKDSS